ncbi:MAG TPA: hypothetical protein VNZ53_49555 [Steroidobacteraceae bacterium]|nr:hypothetical protein [Steroidobacteraceae bacterium]
MADEVEWVEVLAQFLADRLLAARRVSGNVFLTAAASEGDPNRLVLRFSVDEKYVTDTFTRAG